MLFRSSTVQCSRLTGPAVLLLGDAGHGVTPFLGQGCNAALESVGIFDQVRRIVLRSLSAQAI